MMLIRIGSAIWIRRYDLTMKCCSITYTVLLMKGQWTTTITGAMIAMVMIEMGTVLDCGKIIECPSLTLH
jgi:hypothetical protein